MARDGAGNTTLGLATGQLPAAAVPDGLAGRVTASFGVSSCTGGDPSRLVARADDARREAAETGDRVVARW